MTELVDLRDLAAIEPRWLALWQRCPEATVFQSPAWLLPWCRHLLQGRPLALVVERRGELVGLAPLFVWHHDGARVLSIMGAGVSDYLDVLVAPGERAAVVAAMERWLGERRGWDGLLWSELRAGSILLDLSGRWAWRSRIERQDVCPGLRLSGAAGLRDAVPPRSLSSIAYARRQAGRQGGLAVEVASAHSWKRVLGSVERLHAARFGARGGGALIDPRTRRFHRAVCRRLAGSGGLALTALAIGSRVVAAFYGFHDRAATRYYLGGFDPSYARFSPGTLIVADAIERAIARGAERFDFLRGAEPYKYALGAHDMATLYCRRTRRDAP